MKSFNPAISFVRVVAMLSIIVGHICTEYRINTFQFGGIGVEIFLFISGYLYGTREINNYVQWGIKRWKRLIPPLWYAVAICTFVTILMGASMKWTVILTYIFCAQGIGRIVIKNRMQTLLGMGQTWFLTILVVCYILMLLLKKFPKIEKHIDEHRGLYVLGSVFLQITLCYVGIQIVYFLQFFIGYFLSKKDTDQTQNAWVNRRSVVALMVASIISAGVRLWTNRCIDGTILYDRVVARWSFCIISIWLISIMVLVCKKEWAERMVKSRIWALIDIMSYPLFLAHYMFLTGEMKVMNWLNGIAVQLIAFCFLTFIVAVCITLLTEWRSIGKIRKSNQVGV